VKTARKCKVGTIIISNLKQMGIVLSQVYFSEHLMISYVYYSQRTSLATKSEIQRSPATTPLHAFSIKRASRETVESLSVPFTDMTDRHIISWISASLVLIDGSTIMIIR